MWIRYIEPERNAENIIEIHYVFRSINDNILYTRNKLQYNSNSVIIKEFGRTASDSKLCIAVFQALCTALQNNENYFDIDSSIAIYYKDVNNMYK